MTQVIPVRTLTISLVKEGIAEGDILDLDAAAQCLPTLVGRASVNGEAQMKRRGPASSRS
jgi:hypothetical protein